MFARNPTTPLWPSPPRLAKGQPSQAFERVVHVDNVGEDRFGALVLGVVQRNQRRTGASLLRGVSPCIVDKDASHQLSGDTKEVGTVLPRRAPLVHQPQVKLVDERGRAERVVVAFLPKVPAGHAAKLGIHDRD